MANNWKTIMNKKIEKVIEEIIDLKEGWVEAKSWVRDYEDTMPCSSPRDYKEKDFRFFHPVYING